MEERETETERNRAMGGRGGGNHLGMGVRVVGRATAGAGTGHQKVTKIGRRRRMEPRKSHQRGTRSGEMRRMWWSTPEKEAATKYLWIRQMMPIPKRRTNRSQQEANDRVRTERALSNLARVHAKFVEAGK